LPAQSAPVAAHSGADADGATDVDAPHDATKLRKKSKKEKKDKKEKQNKKKKADFEEADYAPPAKQTSAAPGLASSVVDPPAPTPHTAASWLSLGEEGGGVASGARFGVAECYQQALALDPRHVECWLNLSLQRGGVVSGVRYSGLECVQQALQIDPRHVDSWCEMSLYCTRTAASCLARRTARSSACNGGWRSIRAMSTRGMPWAETMSALVAALFPV
jgi:hypothetical protein